MGYLAEHIELFTHKVAYTGHDATRFQLWHNHTEVNMVSLIARAHTHTAIYNFHNTVKIISLTPYINYMYKIIF
jgi:hypothetical protein